MPKYIVIFDTGGFLNGRGRKSAEFPDAFKFTSQKAAVNAADKAKVLNDVVILTEEQYDNGVDASARIMKRLPPNTRVRVKFNHSAGEQVIDLLGCGATGGTCYMQESGSWPRSFNYGDILDAQTVAA